MTIEKFQMIMTHPKFSEQVQSSIKIMEIIIGNKPICIIICIDNGKDN